MPNTVGTLLGVTASGYRSPPPPPIPSVGLAGWWDADDATTITASAGSVSEWRDKSGAAKHFVQATGAAQPKTLTTTVNGRNAVDFDGVDDVMVAPVLSTVVDNFSMFCVCRPNGTQPAGVGPFGNGRRGYNGYAPATRTFGTTIGFLRGGSSWVNGVAPAPTSGVHILSLISTAGTASLRYDTVEDVTGPAGFITPGTESVLGSIDTPKFPGAICEAIFYTKALTTTERQQVESYLKTKWGTP